MTIAHVRCGFLSPRSNDSAPKSRSKRAMACYGQPSPSWCTKRRVKGTDMGERTVRLPEVVAFVFAFLLLWFGCASVLWWSYSMSADVAGGAYGRSYALSAVTKFGFVLSVLIIAVWLRRRKRIAEVRPWRIAWTVWWQTATVLFLYTLIVVTRRQTWTAQRGVNDWAMFFGSLNARFFSELGPLSFVLSALPCIASISAGLFFLLARFRGTSWRSASQLP
jgi:hypothetical protein